MSDLIRIIALLPLLSCATYNTNHGEKALDQYISIEELYRACTPGDCGKDVKLEGCVVYVKGYVDSNNIFDKKSYPQLPYEKFKIYDKGSGKSIEIWAISGDNSAIFKKITQNIVNSDVEIFVSGIVSSFDMPIMGICKKGLKIEINNANDIFFKQ